MKRRTFLKETAGGLGAIVGARHGMPSRAASPPAMTPRGDFPSDGFQAPEWLHYAQPIYFDGYSPPVYPHLKDFDARRLVKVVGELGGNLLRFQPIGYRAYYPSEAFPVHEELGGRDLIAEVARECRRAGIHLYCYTASGRPSFWSRITFKPIPNSPTGSCAIPKEIPTEPTPTSAGRLPCACCAPRERLIARRCAK